MKETGCVGACRVSLFLEILIDWSRSVATTEHMLVFILLLVRTNDLDGELKNTRLYNTLGWGS